MGFTIENPFHASSELASRELENSSSRKGTYCPHFNVKLDKGILNFTAMHLLMLCTFWCLCVKFKMLSNLLGDEEKENVCCSWRQT